MVEIEFEAGLSIYKVCGTDLWKNSSYVSGIENTYGTFNNCGRFVFGIVNGLIGYE